MEQLYFGPLEEKNQLETYRISKSYLYTSALNECLHNHPESSSRAILRQCGVELDFDLNRFWFCLTGLRKEIYWRIYGYDADRYLQLYGGIRREMVELLRERKWRADIFMVMIEDEKQIAVLMSPCPGAEIGPEALAEELGALAQRTYEEKMFRGDRRYCNTTALSEPLSGFGNIRRGYLQTRALNDLSFFRMEPEVLTARRVEALRTGADYQTVMDGCVRLSTVLDQGDRAGCRGALEELFLHLLRGTYSRSLLRDTLSFCRHTLQVRCTARGLMKGLDLEALCGETSCLRIEEWVDRLWPVLERVCTAVEEQGVFSRTVLSAVYYVKNHCGEDISLPDIAAYVNVNPNYLSGSFRENTGLSVRDYITRERVHVAMGLLREGDMRVSDVAEAVGIHDARYFTRVFRRLTGMTPAEYREQAGTE